MTCRSCQGPLFADEQRRATCGVCFRRAVLHLDYLLALAALAPRWSGQPAVRVPA